MIHLLILLINKIFQKKPRIIYTNNSFFLNDFFNFYTAQNILNNKTKYIIGQHGGGYNIGKYHFIKNHEISISDKYISWGDFNDKNSISGSILKSSKFHKLKSKYVYQSDLLYVTNAWENFPTWSLHLNGSSFKKYSLNREIFLNNLNSNILNNINIRLYKHSSYEIQKKYWIKEYPNLKIDLGIKDIFRSFLSAKIIITDFLYSTTYLESIYLDIPTIIINDKNLFKLESESKKVFDQLKNANIYFDSYLDAALHINQVYKNINKWWLEDSVVKSKKDFS